MTAATDSHHYLSISDAVFRFSPVRATTDDLKRFHGTNERLSINNYREMIQFYYRLMSSPLLISIGN
jgi:carboxypeptidase PM20D1